MAYEIVIPRLGLTMESGRLVEWHKQDGEPVRVGELLFAVETDKAVQDVEAPAAGIVRCKPGVIDQELPIGTLLGYIAAPGEQVSWQVREGTHEQVSAPAAPTESVPADVVARSNDKTHHASPSARRRAAELGMDWRLLPGSSREGYVLRADVERAAQATLLAPVGEPSARVTAPLATTPAPAPAAAFVDTMEMRSPLSGVRRIIAERMLASHLQTAPVTLTAEADASELYRLREALKSDSGSTASLTPLYTDFLVKILAYALGEAPLLNARIEGNQVIQSRQINVGIAVDTERGLLVPVVRDVAHKSLRQVAQETGKLMQAARSGKIQPDDLRGGTFTLTNLGMYDIDAFTPIINAPECAILGVGKIAPQAVVVDAAAEKIAVRWMMTLSLTFDHRLVDGGPAARFLQRVKQLVEQPYVWLVN